METKAGSRPAQLAGQWYPGNAHKLGLEVDHYLEQAEIKKLDGEVVAVMAPHAGHIYSGPVAGYAFAALRGLSPDLVVVASPMHQAYYGSFMTSAHDAYSTPLGDVPVDQEAVDLLDVYLAEQLEVNLRKIPHDVEHSIEIQIPFLQRVLTAPYKLLPIMVREQSAHMAHGLGLALGRLLTDQDFFAGRSALLVASTDLSHYYPQSMANELDSALLDQVEAFDPAGVIRIEEQGKGFACGRGALAAVMWAAKTLGANRAEILKYATSGDVSGDYGRVVGYAAAAFLR